MQDFLIVTGMVLKTIPVGDYDRRVVILTKERGKISAFAKGARKQTSKFGAATNPFSFGEFKLYVGKTSYNILECNIQNYFEGLREDFEGAYLGMYFLEVMDYFTRENNDDTNMLKLLYQSLRAISNPSLDNRLVKAVFELKAVVLNGEFDPSFQTKGYLESTMYTVTYIINSSIEKLYTFKVKDEVLNQLLIIAYDYRLKYFNEKFKSLEILDAFLPT